MENVIRKNLEDITKDCISGLELAYTHAIDGHIETAKQGIDNVRFKLESALREITKHETLANSPACLSVKP